MKKAIERNIFNKGIKKNLKHHGQVLYSKPKHHSMKEKGLETFYAFGDKTFEVVYTTKVNDVDARILAGARSSRPMKEHRVKNKKYAFKKSGKACLISELKAMRGEYAEQNRKSLFIRESDARVHEYEERLEAEKITIETGKNIPQAQAEKITNEFTRIWERQI